MTNLKRHIVNKVKVIFLLLAGAPIMVWPQEAVDHAYIRASYEFSYKTDSGQTGYTKADLMYLDIGERVSKFYSKYEQIRDSIVDEGLRKGLPVFEINELRQGYIRGTNSVYYNFLDEKKRTEASNFSFLFTYYDEARQRPQWKMENETKVISGYGCQKASTHYLGREWTVYFTPEIPIDQGPWKLWGLPGLIIQATDGNNYFNYTLKGLERLGVKSPIIFVHTTFDGKEYAKNDKNTFRKMQKLYYTDNEEFMSVFLGTKIISRTNADGTPQNAKLTIAYIPLEPW